MSEIDYNQFDVSIFKDVKIFIATPMYGGTCLGSYTRSMNDLATLCGANGIKLDFFYLFNESLIQRARNYCVDQFLRSDSTHLVFVDADISFNPVTLLQLIAVQLSDPEKYQIVAAPYAKKAINWVAVSEAVKYNIYNTGAPQSLEYFGGDMVMNFSQGNITFDIQKPVEVLEAGTGFMCIPRFVFEKWAAAYPEMSYKPDHVGTEHFDGSRNIHAFFHCDFDPATNRLLSEDYYFCQKWRNIGGTVHMCPWMELHHTGTYTFKGSIGAMATLENAKQTKKLTPTSFKPKKIKSVTGTRP